GAKWRRSIIPFNAGTQLRRRTDDLFGATVLFGRPSFAGIDGVPSSLRPFECERTNRFESAHARKYQSRRSYCPILKWRKSHDYESETRWDWRRPSPQRK